MPAAAPVKAIRRRWDPVIKITHWSIALAVLANALFTEEGSGTHIWIGYGLAGILALRLLWGVIGPPQARFTAFLPSIRRIMTHLGEIKAGVVTPHASHNPLGALMVYAIWACLLVIIGTGVAMSGLPNGNGQRLEIATSASIDDADETGEAENGGGESAERWEDLHEGAANALYLLILVHIAGVVFETRRSGRQLVVAMLPQRE